MLVSMLDCHPEIKCFGELMRITPRWMKKKGYRGALRILDKVDPAFKKDSYRFSHRMEFIKTVFETERRKNMVGFKQHLDQQADFYNKLIKDPEWKIIVLQRENRLAQYSSKKIALETGQGNAPKGTKIIRTTVKFKSHEFKKFVKSREKEWDSVFNSLRDSSKPVFQIRYTDLLSEKTIHNMLEFLEVDTSVNIEPGTEKRNSSNILSRFNNQEEVLGTLEEMGSLEWRSEEFAS